MYYVMGVDFGSMAAKTVILNDQGDIVSTAVAMKGAVSEEGVVISVNTALEKAGLTLADIRNCVSTGYGRRKLDFVDRTITEITCHARGAIALFPQCRMVIDIGGQDSKVIRIDSEGYVEQFAMNDRCAAGTGRFLEVTSGALGVTLDDIGPLSLQSTKNVTVSSMCTVFAETEIISLLAEGVDKTDILNAVHTAIAERVSGMVRRMGIREPVAMTGGVSRNIGVVHALEKALGVKLMISPNSQLAGAYGAALYALKDSKGEKNIFADRDSGKLVKNPDKPKCEGCTIPETK